MKQEEQLHSKMIQMLSTENSVTGAADKLHSCCVVCLKYTHHRLLTIISSGLSLLQLIHAYNFDMRSINKVCVHIVDKDYKIIPVVTMNLFHRAYKRNILKQTSTKLPLWL